MANRSIRTLISLIQKRFLNTTSAALSPTSQLPTLSSSSSFTLQFLLSSCGLPLQSALSASRKLQLHENSLQNPNSVLEFLKSHHFDNTHIAKLIEKRPQVLQCRVEGNLKPKFDFFVENGFMGRLLPELIISNPDILKTALDSQIKPTFQLLKSILDSNENLVVAMKRGSWLLTCRLKSTVQPNIEFLIKEGVPLERVAKLIIWQPRAMHRNHDRLVYVVNALKNFGFEPKATMFIHGFRVMIQMGESTWKKQIEVLKSVGWSEEEILWAFRRFPAILTCSEDKIRSAMEFFVNTMKLSRQTIIANPHLFGLAMDKRIRPRYNVFKILESKMLISRDKSIPWFLAMSNKKFLDNYVIKYADKAPGILEIYGGSSKATKRVT